MANLAAHRRNASCWRNSWRINYFQKL